MRLRFAAAIAGLLAMPLMAVDTARTLPDLIVDCHAQDRQACHDIGHIFSRKSLAQANGITTNILIALDYFDLACGFGHKNACEDRIKIRALDETLPGYDAGYAAIYLAAQCRMKGEGSEACKRRDKFASKAE